MTMAVQERISEDGRAVRRAFVVVGMHRSGTSAMTRTLSLLGAALPKGLMVKLGDNPSGFWEPQSVADLNDEILQALDSEWDDVFAFRPRQYLSNFDRFYMGRAVELLEQEFNGSEVIVLKDPRISVLTTFWDRALRAAGYATHYVIMVRNPLEVAESLRMRDSFPREKSLLLWSAYMIAVDRDTRGRERTFVSYQQLIKDWRAVRDRIQENAGVPFPRDTAAAAIEVDRFIDARLRHHQVAAEDLFSRVDVPEEVKALYRIFSSACEGADIDSKSVEAVHSELEKIDTIVGPLVADLRSRARSLANSVAELQQAHAGARERADSLLEQLAATQAERDRLAAEVEAKGCEAAELTARIAAVEAERESLAALAETERRQAAELAERLNLAESSAQQWRERHEREQARATSISAELQDLSRRHERLSLERSKLERELKSSKAEFERKLKNLKADAEQFETSLREDLRRARAELETAQATAAAGEEKLAERFGELATLTNLLREQEHRNEAAREQLRWLAAVEERMSSQPRWWSLLPRSWRRARQLSRLKRADLFDSEAYLAMNPDVAASGSDPLRHYLNHGIHENRPRR